MLFTLPFNQRVALATVLLTAFVLLAREALAFFSRLFLPRIVQEDVPRFRGLPWLGCSEFFSQRNDFIRNCLQHIEGNVCKIDLPQVIFTGSWPTFPFCAPLTALRLKCRAVVLSGRDACRAFFNTRDFSVERGYLLLHPEQIDWRDIKGMPATKEGASTTWFTMRFSTIMRSEFISERFPDVLSDVQRRFLRLGDGGIIQPFEFTHELVLQLLIRIVCPADIAGDAQKSAYIGSIFTLLDDEASSWNFILPWIPGLKSIRRLYYGARLYRIVEEAVNSRRRAQREESDSIQFMSQKGDTIREMISFIIGAVFAGLVNTSRLQAWLLIYFAKYPEWKTKAIHEMRDFLSAHGATLETLHQIPFDAWESSLPTVDLCMWEIIRLVGDGALLRQNVGEAVDVEGCTIASGMYVVYPMFDVHHDPERYPDPFKYDPGRPRPASDSKNGEIDFVGWGAGRHPCPGRKTATTLVKVVSTHFLLGFDYDLVDRSGHVREDVPLRQLNSLHVAGLREKETCLLKYQRLK